MRDLLGGGVKWSWVLTMGRVSPSSQGAQDSMMPSLADLRMDSGRGMECLTMAP